MKNRIFFFFFCTVALLLGAACDKDRISVDLPAAIREYIAQNYPDYKIDEAEQETLCTGQSVYEVELEAKRDREVELTFDTEGNLLYTESEIKTSELPEAVISRLGADYAGYDIKEAERLEWTEGGVQYEVELKKDRETVEVLVDADGTVVCDEQDDDDE